MLYIVATPIGNLQDITLRAIDILKNCDFVIAENPGYSRRLLQYISQITVSTPGSDRGFKTKDSLDSGSRIFSVDGDDNPQTTENSGMAAKLSNKEVCQFAEFNEQQVVKELARRLAKEDGCLITDAGTPGISDPGFRLVRECVKEGVQVVPIPGASAAITALSASGLPTDRFMFLGFLQKTATKTLEAIKAAEQAEATAIFYESPERIFKTMGYIANAYPLSQVVIARELTKLHEEFIRGTAGEVLEKLKEKPSIKGEFTVLISFKS